VSPTEDLGRALADLASRADADQSIDRLGSVHRRARRTSRNHVLAATVAALLVCGSGAALIARNQSSAAPTGPATHSTPTASTAQPAPTPTPTPSVSPTPTTAAPAGCRTSGLSLRLGTAGGAAGSMYEPIVFTNTSARACTLYAFPGVSFVAPATGHQVGAPASRDRQHPSATITLAPGASASALLQIVDPYNYPPSTCALTAVSGLRVYPPGNTAAAYVPFPATAKACSSQVGQLSVQAIVSGTTGQ
jgi:Protein of unknown function (DUF4232)